MSENKATAARKSQNLSKILERLKPVREQPDLAKVIIGEFQGIFLRRIGNHLEMYCYDIACQKLSEVMSRVDVTAPLNLISPYAQTMMISAFWKPEAPKNVYIAGFGGGRLAINMQHHFENCRFDGSDIDPNMMRVAEDWFGFSPCERFDIIAADSRADLCARSSLYDVILLDVYFGDGAAANHLGTTEFFECCREKLNSNGVVVANLIERDPLHLQKIASMQSVFKHTYIWRHHGTHMVFAGLEAADLREIRRRVRAFERENGSDSNLLKQANRIMRLSKRATAEILSDSEVANELGEVPIQAA